MEMKEQIVSLKNDINTLAEAFSQMNAILGHLVNDKTNTPKAKQPTAVEKLSVEMAMSNPVAKQVEVSDSESEYAEVDLTQTELAVAGQKWVKGWAEFNPKANPSLVKINEKTIKVSYDTFDARRQRNFKPLLHKPTNEIRFTKQSKSEFLWKL